MKRIALFVVMVLISATVFGQTKKDSPWREVQSVIIPAGTKIHDGVTKGGNPKFWIMVEDIQVGVSATNASKFQKGEIQLELVKWEHKENKKLKYSTRQVKKDKPKKGVRDVDLSRLF